MIQAPSAVACHLCGASELMILPAYTGLTRVTSDCKPWPADGRLAACRACGSVQKIVDDRWRAEIGEIYANYAIYHQSGGVEQAVFDAESGSALLRSDRLVERISTRTALPESGRLLDIGCGNGAFLRAFSRVAPGWALAGTELSDKYRAAVEAIPRVEALYTAGLETVRGRYDVISLIHALEHIPHPVRFLPTIEQKLAPQGWLFIEVPDAARNPFDLLVADHASHFTANSLTSLLERAGFEVAECATDWVAKEISVLARVGPVRRDRSVATDDQALIGLRWLLAIREAARATSDRSGPGAFGLFGSSIAATWLAQELAGSVDFFVDEDPNRRGSLFMNRPILTPAEVRPGAHVFIGIGGGLASRIADRLRRSYPAVTWESAGE